MSTGNIIILSYNLYVRINIDEKAANAVSYHILDSSFAFLTRSFCSWSRMKSVLTILWNFTNCRRTWNPLGADTAPYAANAFPSASWECFWRYVSVLTPAAIPLRPHTSARPDVLRMRVWVFTRIVRFLNPLWRWCSLDDPRKTSFRDPYSGVFLCNSEPSATWIFGNSPRSWTTWSFRENYRAD